MKLTATAVALVLLLAFALAAAFGNPAVGKWNCVSVNSESGTKLAWTLNVKEEGGKLSGSVIIGESGDEIPVLEPTLEGNVFRCKVRMNQQETVELSATIDGKQLAGAFKGKDSGTGTFSGVRAE